MVSIRRREQPAPSTEQIARLTAEIRAGWTATEEYERRIVKGNRRVELPVVKVDSDGPLANVA